MHAQARNEFTTDLSTSPDHFCFTAPWILLKNKHKRVNYEFTTMGTGFENPAGDSIALTFQSEFPIEPGTRLDIGVPLPDSMRDYSAEVVASKDSLKGFEINLLITIESDTDLLTLMRSNAYLSEHYNC